MFTIQFSENLYVRYDLIWLRQSQLQQRMLCSAAAVPETSSNSFSSAGFSHTNTQFLSSHLSPSPLSLHPHLSARQHTPLTAPQASSTWALMKYKSGAIKETCLCVCFCRHTVCDEYMSCASGLLFSSFAKVSNQTGWFIQNVYSSGNNNLLWN